MNDFTKAIAEVIKKDLESGMTFKEAIINAGFHQIDGTNTYIMGYGLYEDKALVIIIPD